MAPPPRRHCPHPPSAHRHSPSTAPQIGAGAEEVWGGGQQQQPPPRGSRPNSPASSGLGGGSSSNGKRKYSFNGAPYRQPSYSPNQDRSPAPSPRGSPRVSVTDDSWLANTNQYTNSAIVAAINALTTDGVGELGEGVIPVKARKTTLEHSPCMGLKVEPGADEMGPVSELCQEDYSSRLPFKKESYCGGFLEVPQQPYSWSKQKPYLRCVGVCVCVCRKL